MKRPKVLVLCILVSLLTLLSVCSVILKAKQVYSGDTNLEMVSVIKAIPSNNEILDVKSKLLKRFKELGETEIRPLPIGLLEVSVFGSNEVFYTDLSGDYIILGSLFDVNNNDLTAKRSRNMESLQFKQSIKDVDLTKAIKIGEGKTEVIEFADVDCPYCKESEKFFIDSNATRYIFLYPLDSLHPEAAMKSVHILCSTNPALEYEKVIQGKVTKFNTCEEGKELLAIHRNYGKKLGIKGTPIFFIDGITYSGANPKVQDLVR